MDGLTASGPARAKHAYVTLVTNADYALGARALVQSLVWTGTAADLVVMYTGGVAQSDLAPILALGARLVQVDLLPTSEGFNTLHARRNLHGAAPFTKGEKPSFHTPLDNFAKLRLWQMTDYTSVVFLDADTLVLQNIDTLFDYPQFCAAPNVYEGLADFHRMNSGVFTARPSTETYEAMLAELDQPDVFWRRTDQTFLEHYFPDWHGLPVTYNMLQYVWFNMPQLWRWSSVKVLHYQYEKPWQVPHPKADQLEPLITLWHQYLDGKRAPDLASLENPE
ncbi:glycosyl transferase [Donghicola sp. C2-DW-16]|uniref:Glycosyl transferase n=1 Tax=Donghicola mangrovi TaxID=2729614 RepID=A0ABX2PGZ6_9RHOB|nr:glycosyltransferase [Donghicola mangrovi]NVO27859.1 glycosyl transferase [Donghicola mangrovi]